MSGHSFWIYVVQGESGGFQGLELALHMQQVCIRRCALSRKLIASSADDMAMAVRNMRDAEGLPEDGKILLFCIDSKKVKRISEILHEPM